MSSELIVPAGENFIQIDEDSAFPICMNLQILGESSLKQKGVAGLLNGGGEEREEGEETGEGGFHFVLTPSDNPSSQAISGGVVVRDGEVSGVGVGGWFSKLVEVVEGVRGEMGRGEGGRGEEELFGLLGGFKREGVVSIGYGEVMGYEQVCVWWWWWWWWWLWWVVVVVVVI